MDFSFFGAVRILSYRPAPTTSVPRVRGSPGAIARVQGAQPIDANQLVRLALVEC
jgi:hypothetical protein